MGLITRFYGPNQKGSELTIKDMDDNLYFLQSKGVESVSFSSNTLTLTNPTGGTLTTTINTGSDFLTTTVTVTAADFIAAPTVGDTVKTLIPSPGAGKYIFVNLIIGKFKDATIAFNNGFGYTITEFKGTFTFGLSGLGTTPDIVAHGTGVVAEVNQSLDLKLNYGIGPTVGDGNIIFEIEYKILDF